MNVKEYTVQITAATRAELNVIGTQVRCVDCPTGFALSIDNGQELPFGVGRTIKTKEAFQRLAFIWSGDTFYAGTLTIRVVVTLGVENYDDARVAFFDGAGVTVRGAADMFAEEYVHGGAGLVSLGARAGQFLVNVRNTHATETIRVGLAGTTGSAQIAAGKGLILEPGENADIPAGASEANPTGVSIRIYANAGATYCVTWFMNEV